MLYTRTSFKLSNTAAVKTAGRSLAIIASLGTLALAGSAHAGGGLLVDKVITVKISASELAAPDGVEKIYNLLKRKAQRVCRADRKTLFYTGETVAECSVNLLEQFVVSSELPSLQSIHEAQDT